MLKKLLDISSGFYHKIILMEKEIAVVFQGSDCLRIIPMQSKNGYAGIKFHFFDDSFVIRTFDSNSEIGGLLYKPIDHGQAEHEKYVSNINLNICTRNGIRPFRLRNQRSRSGAD